MFVCYFQFLRNVFTKIETSHLPVKGCKFRPIFFALLWFQQWSRTLLKRITATVSLDIHLWGLFRGLVTLAHVLSVWQWKCFDNLGLSRSLYGNPTFCMRTLVPTLLPLRLLGLHLVVGKMALLILIWNIVLCYQKVMLCSHSYCLHSCFDLFLKIQT